MLERLESGHHSPSEDLTTQPDGRANAVEDHIRWDFPEHDTQREQLLTDVEPVLRDADVFHEVVGKGISNVAFRRCQQLAC
jgi:hypothetical protein